MVGLLLFVAFLSAASHPHRGVLGGTAERFKPNAMKVLTPSFARFSLSRARIKRLLLTESRHGMTAGERRLPLQIGQLFLFMANSVGQP